MDFKLPNKNNYMLKSYKAFTLAEILITLIVIGILAVITIPSILQSWEEIATVNKLRKTYSILQQAYKLAEIENGSPDTWGIVYSKDLDKLKPYLKIAKSCSSVNKGCVFDGKYKFLRGDDYGVNFANSSSSQFLLQDETAIATNWLNSKCSFAVEHSDNPVGLVEGNDSCTSIMVDLNGIKPPNTYGKDFFCFSLTKAGILPWGGISTAAKPTTYSHSDCITSNHAWGCARWVIERGNMDYLHKTTTW